MENYIEVEKTAISTGVARSVKIFSDGKYIDEVGKDNILILDYGCGKLRNSKYLINQGFRVDILDTPKQINKIKDADKILFNKVYTTDDILNEQYNIIFNTFVLNVIPDINIRKDIILNMIKLLKIKGRLVIEVRNNNSVYRNKYKKEYLDGFIIGNNKTKTFQKGYDEWELYEFIKRIGDRNKIDIQVAYSFKTSGSIVIVFERL